LNLINIINILMENLTKYILSITVTALSVSSIIIFFFFENFTDVLLNFQLVVATASIVYSGYMLIYTCKNPTIDDLRNDLITDANTNFIVDTYAKYLFPFLFASFIYTFLNLVGSSFKIIDNYTIVFLFRLYIGIVLPIIALLEVIFSQRRRVPKLILDVSILMILCFGFMGYYIIFNLIITTGYSYLILPTVSNYLNLSIYIFNGYLVYDYLLHRKNNSDANYVLFNPSSN
jgi:hypothetical protein